MSDQHMTVGDVIEALSRYDRDRVVAAGSMFTYPVKSIQSIEPGGAVLIVQDHGGFFDANTVEWKEYGA